MPETCAGRVALVTGASRGIGRAIATRLAAEGASVAICSRPRPGMADLGTLEAARDEIAAGGGTVLAIPFDLSDPMRDRASLVDEVEAELGPVDILVNNAAAGGMRPFLDWTDEQIELVLELNLWAPWQLIRRVLPGMRARGRGWILNVSSQTAAAPQGPPFPHTHPSIAGTMYGGSKAFLNRWTASLAAEVHPDGIVVNTLAPEAAAETEVLLAYADLPDYLYEPLDTMAEAALALCTAGPDELTGRNACSLSLLVELDRPVFDLTGTELVPDWQPDSMPPRIQQMVAHARGELAAEPSNIDTIVNRRR